MSQIEVKVADIDVTKGGYVRSVLSEGFCEKENHDGTFTIYTGDIADFGERVGKIGFAVKKGEEVLYFDPSSPQYEKVFEEGLKEIVRINEEIDDDDDDFGPAIR